jgi:hypothetical protein
MVFEEEREALTVGQSPLYSSQWEQNLHYQLAPAAVGLGQDEG